MSSRVSTVVLVVVAGLTLVGLEAADVSQQQADAFDRKLAQIAQRGTTGIRGGGLQEIQRTPFSEAEVNSWITYRGPAVLPTGVTAPQVTMIGNGRLRAAATVDLEALAKQRTTGRLLDPWRYLGGRLPVTMSGVLRTQEGTGQFEIEDAAVSGVPVPTSLLQDIVSYYSRSADDPEGIRLDDPFKLPAQIRQIEVVPGQAVVVQ
jgi:hypothetical protein